MQEKCYLNELELSFVKNVIEHFPGFNKTSQFSIYENKLSFHFLAQLLAPEKGRDVFEQLLLKNLCVPSQAEEKRLNELKAIPIKRAFKVLHSLAKIETLFNIEITIDFMVLCFPYQEFKSINNAFLVTEKQMASNKEFEIPFLKLKNVKSVSEILNNKKHLNTFTKYIRKNAFHETVLKHFKKRSHPTLAMTWIYFCFDKLFDEGYTRRRLEIYMNEHLRLEDNNKGVKIYYGERACELLKNDNEYFLARILFDNRGKRLHKKDVTDYMVEISGKESLSGRAVDYATRNINKKFKSAFKYVDNLILFESPYVWINENIIAISETKDYRNHLLGPREESE